MSLVNSRAQRIIVHSPDHISVVNGGPQGIQGPPGSGLIPGTAGQENYALVWVGPGIQDYELQEQESGMLEGTSGQEGYILVWVGPGSDDYELQEQASGMLEGTDGQEGYVPVWVGPGPDDYELQLPTTGVTDHGDLTGRDNPADHPWAALDADLDAEVIRATTVEGTLTTTLANEITNRAADIDAEESRATTAEGILTTNLATEITNRTADVNAEEARAIIQENLKIPLTQKGTANGVADLDVTGKVPTAQLPAYVDDVVEAVNFAALPGTGETGKIYVTLDDNKTYRWSGSAYVEISSSLSLGETSATAYRGDRGKTAYDHSQLVTGNPHAVTKTDVGLSNVDNTSDVNKPISTLQQTALNTKAPLASPTFTGTPAGPTAAVGTNTTQLATTAFVTAAVAAAPMIVTSDSIKVPWNTTTGPPAVTTLNVDNVLVLDDADVYDTNLMILDSDDITRKVRFDIANATVGATTIISLPSGVTTAPTLVTAIATQTLTNKSYSSGKFITGLSDAIGMTVRQSVATHAKEQNDGTRCQWMEVFGYVTQSPFINFLMHSGTAGTPAGTNINVDIGGIRARPYMSVGTGNDWTPADTGRIRFVTSEATTSTAHGTRIDLFTTPTGTVVTTAPTRAFTITADTVPGIVVRGAVSVNAGSGFASAAANVGVDVATGAILTRDPTYGFGYGTGAGGTVTQGTNRTTGVTLNKICGSIVLFTAAGSTTFQAFTVTNSTVAATDIVIVNQKSGTDRYYIWVTNTAAGSFVINYATITGTTNEAPVFNFIVIKAVVA